MTNVVASKYILVFSFIILGGLIMFYSYYLRWSDYVL